MIHWQFESALVSIQKIERKEALKKMFLPTMLLNFPFFLREKQFFFEKCIKQASFMSHVKQMKYSPMVVQILSNGCSLSSCQISVTCYDLNVTKLTMVLWWFSWDLVWSTIYKRSAEKMVFIPFTHTTGTLCAGVIFYVFVTNIIDMSLC